jgi:cytochrome P450
VLTISAICQSLRVALPAITPMPPVADAALPWDRSVGDAVAVIGDARAALGDTFVVDSGGDRYLFTFSPAGVAALYELRDEQASKGVADWRMLRRKVPDSLFSGRRTFPHDLFGRNDSANYMANVHSALSMTVEELGPSGTIDVFDLTRRLGHRVGLASWGGPGSSRPPILDDLIAAFDVLDGSEAFVHPDAMAQVTESGKAAENAALETVTDLIASALDLLDADPELSREHPLFNRIAASWSDETHSARRTGVAHDVALVHIASMSNLFAAMGWAFADLLGDEPARRRVREGNSIWAEQCAMESTRMAQRSIMSRYVLEPVTFSDGSNSFLVAPGVTIATLLPLTNTSSAPGYDLWNPYRWNRRRLADPGSLPAIELVTVFGHGKHTCPAQPFSLAAMTAATSTLLSSFDWVPGWSQRPKTGSSSDRRSGEGFGAVSCRLPKDLV